MRSRNETLKSKAAAIAAGERVDDDEEPQRPPVDPPLPPAAADAPKRRSRSQVAAVQTSGQLADEMEQQRVGQQRRAEEARMATVKSPAELKVGGGIDRIVTHLFTRDDDPMETYQQIRASLRLGTRASSASSGQLVDALDAAEENAMQAMELLVNAKVAHDAFEIDAKMVLGAVRENAYAALQAEKQAGVRSKAITDADVESVMAAKHPDDWQEIQEKLGKAKRTIDFLAELCDRARERAKDLRSMVNRVRDA